MSTYTTVRLSGDCTLRTIRAVRNDIAAALKATDNLEIDCADAGQVDITFAQLITSATQTARREAKQLRVVNLSDAARTCFTRAGLSAPGASAVAS